MNIRKNYFGKGIMAACMAVFFHTFTSSKQRIYTATGKATLDEEMIRDPGAGEWLNKIPGCKNFNYNFKK